MIVEKYIDGPTLNHEFILPRKCMANEGHAHAFDHITFVRRGAVLLYVRPPCDADWKFEGRYDRGDLFTTRAGVEHKIKADSDGTVYVCVFVHRDFGSAETVQEYNGNHEAYA